jgi:D-erythro-7,8-dihydroneopterin triphosphate epimerase
MKIATIRITDITRSTIIGANEWERETPQEVIINIEFSFDASKAIETDRLDDTVNYKHLKKRIVAEVETSRYRLIEKLAARILDIVLEDARILRAAVRVDKPGALRYAKSVSVEVSDSRSKKSARNVRYDTVS